MSINETTLELGMELLGEAKLWPAAEVRGFIHGAVMALMAAGLEEAEAVKKLASAAPRLTEIRGLSVMPEDYQVEWQEQASLYWV